jgi:transcriptional regulator with XRE-family HTH domain
LSKLSRFLKERREQRGWSQTDLAAQSGIPIQSISRWENPRYRGKPSHDNILLLAAALDMTPYDVLKFIGYPARRSNNDEERDERWSAQRDLLVGDPRAERILEMYEQADDEERDGALSILETYFTRRRPRRRQ